jgi:hypothetical protein
MNLVTAGGSFAARLAVREGEALDMARRTGLRAVGRHSRVVEKIAAQFDLGLGHRIVHGDARFGKSLR